MSGWNNELDFHFLDGPEDHVDLYLIEQENEVNMLMNGDESSMEPEVMENYELDSWKLQTEDFLQGLPSLDDVDSLLLDDFDETFQCSKTLSTSQAEESLYESWSPSSIPVSSQEDSGYWSTDTSPSSLTSPSPVISSVPTTGSTPSIWFHDMEQLARDYFHRKVPHLLRKHYNHIGSGYDENEFVHKFASRWSLQQYVQLSHATQFRVDPVFGMKMCKFICNEKGWPIPKPPKKEWKNGKGHKNGGPKRRTESAPVNSSQCTLKRLAPVKNVKLPQFIYTLLSNPYYSSVISWKNPRELIFVIVNTKKIARLWCQVKDNEVVSYDNFTRSIRTARDQEGVFLKMEEKHNKVYQFSTKGFETARRCCEKDMRDYDSM